MATLEQVFKSNIGDTQKVGTLNTKVVLTSFPIQTKTTVNGIKITLKGKTIEKIYSKNYRVFLTFSTKKQALKEFNKHRKSHKEL